MGYAATITSKGQITLPADLRAELGLGPGDKVYFLKGLDDQYRIVVRKPQKWNLEPMFVWDGPTVTIEMMDPGYRGEDEKPE